MVLVVAIIRLSRGRFMCPHTREKFRNYHNAINAGFYNVVLTNCTFFGVQYDWAAIKKASYEELANLSNDIGGGGDFTRSMRLKRAKARRRWGLSCCHFWQTCPESMQELVSFQESSQLPQMDLKWIKALKMPSN